MEISEWFLGKDGEDELGFFRPEAPREAGTPSLTPSILITGASGFVGRNLLPRIRRRRYGKLICLSRSALPSSPALRDQEEVHFLRGSLFDLSQYERELSGTHTVVHLAAATGKNPPEEYFRVNVEGTRRLAEHCQRVGVERILHVSSIAVRFPTNSCYPYPYARSKQQAEDVVRFSGLRYVILRPTIVLGRDSPIWITLSRLAKLPVIPIPGDGKALLQPIDVDDLVDFILAILDQELFSNETFDLGGPQVISVDDFLQKIHWLRYHRKPRSVHLPLTFVLPLLARLEKPFYSLLPVTVGQLHTFFCDGTIETNRLFAQRASQLKTIDEILASLCSHDRH